MPREIKSVGHIRCEKCNKTFESKKSLKNHLSEEHAY
ncbi:MAG TPA: C2H2-type zinc finger protein [Nitrososphaera sp.]|nr:C2H2-type zinc finger protein [Nitrososphaera sp.]